MAGRSFFRFHRVCAPPCAKKIQSVFRGGVYAAKNTLRGVKCRWPAKLAKARNAAKPLPNGFAIWEVTKKTLWQSHKVFFC